MECRLITAAEMRVDTFLRAYVPPPPPILRGPAARRLRKKAANVLAQRSNLKSTLQAWNPAK